MQTEWFLQYTNQTKEPLIHFWQTAPTVILGMKDRTLKELSHGLSFLHQQNYNTVLRSSGGLAVVSDEGVLNVSLFLPMHDTMLAIDEAYELMTQWTRKALHLAVETGEIVHSYCPGTYDLSINHQKIAGMSQRRFQNGVVVMMYLGVNGKQEKRSKLIQSFYRRSQATNDFPLVQPEAMTTLEELLSQPVTVDEVKQQFLAAVPKTNHQSIDQWMAKDDSQQQWQKIVDRFAYRQSLLKEGE